MGFSTVLYRTAAFFAVAFPGFCQFVVASSSLDGTNGTISVKAYAPIEIRTVTGAPYSGRDWSELVRTLADGTHLTRPTGRETVTYRDSSGRIRTERPFFRGTTSTAPFALIEVQDPVAGYAWMLDYVNRIAHRVPAKLRSATAELPPGYTTPERSTLPDGTTQASEPLSTKTMFGVTVVGVKTTATSPAGSGLGNDRPVTTVSEDWMSPQVGLVIYSRYSRPGGDESTRTLKDLSTAEPDPSLFRIPPDYQIIDETGSFTMKVSLQN